MSFKRNCLSLFIFLLFTASSTYAQLADSLAKRFQYIPEKHLNYKVDSSYVNGKVKIKKISYFSTDSFLVTAFLIVPQVKGKTPLIIFQHWGEGNKTEFLEEAINFSRNGITCILPDAVWLCPKSNINSMKKKGYEMYRQGVMNIRTALDLAMTNFKIDSSKVCFVGHSYGSNIGAILSGIESRINNYVFMTGVYSNTKSMAKSKDADDIEWKKTAPAEYKAWMTKMRTMDAELYLPYKTVPCIIQVAEKDEYISKEENDKFIKITPEPKLVQSFNTGHKLDTQAQFRRQKWIITKLK
jgi:cephalosporin-C deacetylase-like acetyl esterase